MEGFRSCDMVVSLLERDEVSELGLQREAELCRASGIEFIVLSDSRSWRAWKRASKRCRIARSIAERHCRRPLRRSSLPGRDWPVIHDRGMCHDLLGNRGQRSARTD